MHINLESISRAAAWVVGKVWGPVKRVLAIRKAASKPPRARRSFGDKSVARTLADLGGKQTDGGWVATLTTAAARLATKQGVFGLPYVNEWLSQHDVGAMLKALHQDDLAQVPRDPQKFEQLALSFQAKSGDNAAQAESVIGYLLAAVLAGTESSVKDPGLAAMMQATAGQTHKTLASLVGGVEALRGDVGSRPAEGARTFNDEQASGELDRLLVKRTMPGEVFVKGLEKLEADIRDGRFSIVHAATKVRVLNWLARVRAWDGDVDQAQKLLNETAALGGQADLPTQANLEAAKGDVGSALRLLQTEDSVECRSSFLGLLGKHKGPERAAEKFLLDGRLDDPNRFSGNGWITALSILVSNGHFAQAHTVCDSLTEELLSSQPYLSFICGVVAALEVVPADRRADVAAKGPDLLVFGTLDGPEATQWRNRAIAYFSKAIDDSRRLQLQARMFEDACRTWTRMLRLTDETLRDAEVKSIQAEMADPVAALEAVRLVQAHRIEADTSYLEAYLDRQELLVGLNSEELLARAAVLALKERWMELADLVEANWSRLLEIAAAGALVGQVVDALVKAQQFTRAEEFLEKQGALLAPDELRRLGLLIVQAKGGDLAAGAAALYEDTGALIDLRNLVAALASRKRWSDAVPFSRELFDRESNLENANQHLELMSRARASEEAVLEFIEYAEPKAAVSLDLKLRKASALHLRGRFLESRELADELLAARDDVRDVSLDLNLAMQSGDWEHFPTILERAWQKRERFSAHTLMWMANMAGLADPNKALEIARDAAARTDADGAILMNAYMLAVKLGRDEEGNQWLAKVMAEQQAPDGVVKSFTLRQTVEMVKGQQEAWQQKLDDFRQAKYPVHLAAALFNAPLTRFLVDLPRQNADEADARRRMPLPFRSGRRLPVDCNGLTSAVFDVTTIFYADQFGILDSLLRHFDQVHIASQTFSLLLEETQRVVFHQPSRIAEAKLLASAVDRGRIRVLAASVRTPLSRRVGVEVAALLERAQQAGGMFVHDGEVYDVGSFMEHAADLGELRELLISPLDVARSLLAKGYVTDLAYSEATRRLERPGYPAREPKVVELGKLFLDASAIGAIQRAGLLTEVLNACSEAWVYDSTVLEWRSLVEAEGEGEEAKFVIDRIRRTLRTEVLCGKVHLLAPAPERSASFIGEKGMALIDVAASGSVAQLVVLDDRLLNREQFIVDRKQRKVPLACLLDMLDLLVASGAVTTDKRDDVYHQLRRRCMYCVPLTVESLSRMVAAATVGSDGTLSETAHLRTLREYVSRLISADALCTEDDRVFLDSLWTVGTAVVQMLWGDLSVPTEKALAASNWLLMAVIPSFDAAFRGFEGSRERAEEIAAVRVIALTTAAFEDEARFVAHRAWTDAQILGRLLPAGGHLLDVIAARIEAATLKTMKGVVDDAAGKIDA